MSLRSFYGKKVNIVCENGQIFCGIVEDYIFQEDNENGLESIIIKTKSGDLYEFYDEVIDRITVV